MQLPMTFVILIGSYDREFSCGSSTNRPEQQITDEFREKKMINHHQSTIIGQKL
jgi:hypothetical protein